MRVLISGGGTGGHTSPASSIIEELRKRDPYLLLQWVGKKGAIEERVAKSLTVPFRAVPAAGWPRKRGPRQIFAGLKFLLSTVIALRYVRSFQPQVAVGVGGYVSLPPLLAAQWLGVPTFVHEQNKRLGMANRLLAKRATRIFLSYPDTLGEYPRNRAEVVGNPVRAGFTAPPTREAAREQLDLKQAVPCVLVVGGSQGAQSINRAVADWIKTLAPEDAQVLWMTGPQGVDEARKAASQTQASVQVFGFIEDMPAVCAAADVIISRAGASSTAEIAAIGRASILIPFPFATDDHQTKNAEAFVEADAALLVADKECTGARLGELMGTLLRDEARRLAMEQAALSLARPNAAELIVDGLLWEVFEDLPGGER